MLTEPLDTESLLTAAGGAAWSGMPRGTTIGHVHLHVGDLDRAADFYHAALGLDKMVWSYRGALFLAAGGYHHHLGVNVWAGSSAVAPDENEARLLDWELLVPEAADLSRLAASLEGAGIAVQRGEGGELELRDPWGTGLRVTSSARG
jgi:catechol 2,3-dioxygenase